MTPKQSSVLLHICKLRCFSFSVLLFIYEMPVGPPAVDLFSMRWKKSKACRLTCSIVAPFPKFSRASLPASDYDHIPYPCHEAQHR